ncbi:MULTISPECIES: Zn-dependent hydrolase [Halopseudomonas]|uniref:N-carbamoyl-L-amino-acid hydrolase n=1 Tax=Halopseudomonas bauzanensis TaxID=653930 RepID=A0A1I4Q812_9GAMM|nr:MULTISPECIES: Zn-dependent hydrolase [Halopseudomonas]WGK61981.1 Zn-dependent hydrolase [Halopseudomonas sp. SMJS2]SES34797.1 N-carbamoyl-L-amino-acid hydrolase [Halopseudomonas bauzanensis]SFM36222.1 N-carbamoyl-L-amino-acid hydrolase [Halopseudomonas bauzanensis]
MQKTMINQQRLWQSLMDMGEIGGTEKGGVCRLALTDLDKQARDLFVQWCKDAGCTIRIDKMGNIFAHRAGLDDSLPPVVMGSHLDTQPTGGKFDGIYGVLAGLEVIRTLNDKGMETRAPIEASVWTNEEGSRFPPAMVASGVFAGVFELDYGLSRADLDGKTMGQELERIGYNGPDDVGGRPFKAFFEAHIEQGPILEDEKKQIGVVTDAQGQRWYEITLTGQESHAGPTPMSRRRDALVGAARLIDQVNKIGLAHQPNACATVGLLQVFPNSRNVIPGQVFFTVDFRHPDADVLAKMDQALRETADSVTTELGLEMAFEQIWYSPPVPFDTDCVALVRQAATDFGYSHRDIVSGAGHDACYISRVAPTAMVFVPCENGISHNEAENATPEDLAAGCNVLFQAVVERANS